MPDVGGRQLAGRCGYGYPASLQSSDLKSHFPDGAVMNLLKSSGARGLRTVRDPVDASKSWGRVFPEAPDPVKAWLEWHQDYKGLFLEIPFAEIGSWKEIFMIQKHLTGRVLPLVAGLT